MGNTIPRSEWHYAPLPLLITGYPISTIYCCACGLYYTFHTDEKQLYDATCGYIQVTAGPHCIHCRLLQYIWPDSTPL